MHGVTFLTSGKDDRHQGRIQRLFGHSGFYLQNDKTQGRWHNHTPN